MNIIIYEDSIPLVHELTLFLNNEPGFEVLASFDNCTSIAYDCKTLKPDLVILDINLPEQSGLEGLRELRKTNKDVKVVMFTVLEDEGKILEALKFGANGYLVKGTPPHILIENLKEALKGGTPLSGSIATKVLNFFKVFTPVNELEELTDKEKKVLQLLSQGHSYKMISSELDFPLDTVRSCIKKIYLKLNVHSKGEAILVALRNKI